MAARVFLALSALVWLPYGLFCFFQPEYLEQAAGVFASTATGTIELRAMYGGLQTGFGLFCLLGALRREFFRPALTALLLVVGGLALARLYSTATSADPVGGYTWAAMAYEFTTATLAGLALRKA